MTTEIEQQLEGIVQRINNERKFAELNYNVPRIETSEFTIEIGPGNSDNPEYDLSFGSSFNSMVASFVTKFRKIVRFQEDTLTVAEIATWVARVTRYAEETGLGATFEQMEE